MEYAIDVAAACPGARGQDRSGDRRLHLPGTARGLLPRTWTRPTSTSRASPRISTGRSAARSWAPCSTRCATSADETRVWLEMTTLLIPGAQRLGRRARGDVRAGTRSDLGPDVPLHFTAFHPDWKMRDVPADAIRRRWSARADRASARAALRLHRQCARPRGRQHLVPRVRGRAHRSRRLRHRPLGPCAGRTLRQLRRGLRGRVRRGAGRLGLASRAGHARRRGWRPACLSR